MFRRPFSLVLACALLAASWPPSAGAIDGGQVVSDGALPRFDWVAALVTADGAPWCTASFISEKRLVTAAHCVNGPRIAAVHVGAGSSGKPAHVYSVVGTVAHPGYVANTGSGSAFVAVHDLAIVEIAGRHHSWAALGYRAPAEGTSVTMYGYGSPWRGRLTALQETVSVGVGCGSGASPTSDLFCLDRDINATGTLGGIVCPGDSGGPVVQGGAIVGVTSVRLQLDAQCPGDATRSGHTAVVANRAFLEAYVHAAPSPVNRGNRASADEDVSGQNGTSRDSADPEGQSGQVPTSADSTGNRDAAAQTPQNPDTVEAGAADPDTVEAGAADPDTVEAGAADPETAEAGAADPETAEADAAGPDTVEADTADDRSASELSPIAGSADGGAVEPVAARRDPPRIHVTEFGVRESVGPDGCHLFVVAEFMVTHPSADPNAIAVSTSGRGRTDSIEIWSHSSGVWLGTLVQHVDSCAEPWVIKLVASATSSDSAAEALTDEEALTDSITIGLAPCIRVVLSAVLGETATLTDRYCRVQLR